MTANIKHDLDHYLPHFPVPPSRTKFGKWNSQPQSLLALLPTNFGNTKIPKIPSHSREYILAFPPNQWNGDR